MKYILASASPRRKELLEQAGFRFQVIPSSVEEKITKDAPSEIVMELASQKARDVYEHYGDADCVVIGADTIVAYNGEILGKPATQSEAYDMLAMLADRTHQVYTGVSLIMAKGGQVHTRTFFEATDVTFYPISKEDLRSYAETGDSLDKAGAYGIQGYGSLLVEGICGDYFNVMGLPVAALNRRLKALGRAEA